VAYDLPRRVREERTCPNCGAPLRLELGFSVFCSAMCVREGNRLREQTDATLEGLRREIARRARAAGKRRSWFGRLRGEVELDENAATVIAMSAAGATVRQIARYTALEASDVQRLLAANDRGSGRDRAAAPAPRAEMQ
jgi:hypothetical protein